MVRDFEYYDATCLFIFIWHPFDISILLQVESNGTVLSTNWKEVGTKKVEGSPPDGMELRKWEY